MKILLLAPKTPSPTSSSAQARAYHLLAELAKRHGVSLAYWVCDPSEVRHINSLRSLCKGGSVTPVYLNRAAARFRGLHSLLQGGSYSQGYFGHVSFQGEMERLEKKERFDLIYAFTPMMAQYAAHRTDIPLVVDFADGASGQRAKARPLSGSLLRSPLSCDRRRRLDIYRAVARKATARIFASQAEADLFQRFAGYGANYVVANGVDMGLRRLPISEARGGVVGMASRRPTLGFAGALNDASSQDALKYFVKEIFPLVKKHYPETRVQVVGPTLAKFTRWLDGARGIMIARETTDIRAQLVQTDIIVAPLRAGGDSQNHILAALAVGVPVVASSEAIKSLPPMGDQEVLVGDQPEEFAAQILRLLNDQALHRRVAAKGRKFAAEQLSWKVVGAGLAGLLERLGERASERGTHFEPRHRAL